MILDVIGPGPVEDTKFYLSEYWPFIIIGIIALIGLYMVFRVIKRNLLARVMYGKRGR